jgi:PAS domain S-box-containing protein
MDNCNLQRILNNQSWFPPVVFWLLMFAMISLQLLSIASAHASDQLSPERISSRLNLTLDEQGWLAEHPVINLGAGIYPPLNFMDDHGKSIGISPDYLKLIATRLGITINMVSGDWTEIQALAKEHKLDGLGLIFKNSERQKYFDFAGPYTSDQYAILVNKETQGIAILADLSYKRVGIMAGDYAQGFLKENHTEVDLVLYKTNEEALHALVNREVEAVLGNLPTLTYFIDKHLMTGLKVAGLSEVMAKDEYVAIRKDWPQFTAILNKAFASISQQEHQKIRSKWLGLYPPTNNILQLVFTEKQKEWLAQQHKVRVWVTNLPPYIIIKEGRSPEGIAIDYLNIIAQHTGIHFSYQAVDKPFSELLENIKQKQYIDFTPIIVPRSERQKYMLFSNNYIESPTVIAVRNKSYSISDIQGLIDKSVGVLKASNLQKLLSAKYPSMALVLYDSNELALEALSKGHIDSYVGSLTHTTYIIQARGFSNIYLIASNSFESEHFAMGNRKDWPELTAIINLSLGSISEKEKAAILNKYVAVKYHVQGVGIIEMFIWGFVVICIAIIIVLFYITWNRSLRKLVDSRTRALKLEIFEREEVHNALLKSQGESIRAQKIANLGHWEWDVILDEIVISDEIYNIFGLSIGTPLNSKLIMECIHPEDHDYYIKSRAKALESQSNHTCIFRIIRPDGVIRTLSSKTSTVIQHNDTRRAMRLFGIFQDITERKKIEQELLHYQQRLKSLALKIALVEEQERRHIAADLHDNVGQSLALTRLQLAAVLKRLPGDKKTAELLEHCSKMLLTVIQDTRHLIFEISSPSLNEFGLSAAITEWKEQYKQQRYGFEVEIIDRLKIDFVSLDLRAILFRNIRELLVNVIKHAKATEVVVTLEEKLGHYMITVKDDGIGFITDQLTGGVRADGGFGLFNIQERMIDLGGELLINSKLKEGCTMVLSLPVIEMET